MNSLSVIGKIKAFIVFLLLVSSSAYASVSVEKILSKTSFLGTVGDNGVLIVGKNITRMGEYRRVPVIIGATDDFEELGLKKGWALFYLVMVSCYNQSVGVEFMQRLDSNGNIVTQDFPKLKMEQVNRNHPLSQVVASVCNKKG